ncbi:glycosyl hydrolase family 28 protein [Pelagicoccus albus]|uniref:Polygalacturonase n=1 Tax=Pelagicoccus albus TaxID=415222 RepID=A0A7X1E8I6_9BACT|nr:glycosyl hydrolase family 28 protein [Pelagicoccus albus]MBC2606830.1 hypothetical protein [Pelagicoccus albus]
MKSIAPFRLSVALTSLSLLIANLNGSSKHSEILLEAENGNPTPPFQIFSDTEASAGSYIWAPETEPNAETIEQSLGHATFHVEIPEAGEYELWGKVFTPGAPRTRKDSFFVDVNGEQLTWFVHDWADNWVWRKLTVLDRTRDISFELPAGDNEITISHRVSGTKIDQIKLVPVRPLTSLFGGIDPTEIEASSTKLYENLSPYFHMEPLKVPQFPDQVFSIVDYGAIEGGFELNTEAIAKAIEACADAGGGRVLVPAGRWLTGPIHLKSNVDFHVSEGATVLFSTDRSHYLPVVFTRWEGMECYNYSAPIYANGQKNIALSGKGVLHGQGHSWWGWKRKHQKAAAKALYQMIQDGLPPEERIMGDTVEGLCPNFVQFVNCRDVLIENLTFVDGPMWTLHPIYVDGMVVRAVKVTTSGPNNDGINPDSTRNLLIEDCYFSTGDDCVVLKSGLNEDGWRVGRPTENVVIRNIYGNEGHGGVVIGSEMSGGVRNVYAHDCYFVGTDRGIRLKSMRGRGAFIEDLYCERIKMSDIGGQAIRINSFYSSSTLKPASEVPPSFKNMLFKDISCEGAARAVEITGLEESLVANLKFENIQISANQGFIATDAENITLENVKIETQKGPAFAFHNTQNVELKQVSDGSENSLIPEISGERSANIR